MHKRSACANPNIMKDKLQVLVVDDHGPFRKALTTLLQLKGFIVTDTAGGEAFVQALQTVAVPDIAIVSYKTTNPASIETIRFLHEHYPAVRIVISSLFDLYLPMDVFEEMGVAGVCIKSKMNGEELVNILSGL